jgi:competence protein ComGG
MRKNKNGFTYPLTLMILLLFLTFFTVKAEKLLSEKRLTRETTIILQEEYYIHTSVTKIVKMYQLCTPIPAKGIMMYAKGTMEYQSEKPIGTVQKINFTLRLFSGETFLGIGYFDVSSKRIVKWVEKK